MNNDILWIEPVRKLRNGACDVRISHYENHGRKKMSIVFYNNSDLKVSHHGYMAVGIDTKNMRLLLKDPYPNTAYKVVKAGNNKRVDINFNDESFNGSYNLVLDDEVAGAWHTERVR